MKYEPYAAQHRIKQQNREKILSLLNEKERTFTELLKLTEFSPAGLTKMLDELVKENKIKKMQNKKKSPYKLVGKGMNIKDLLFLGNVLTEIRENGGKYYLDYPDHYMSDVARYGPFWGLLSHLFIDKNIGKNLNPFSKRDIFDIERYIFEKIRNNVKHYKIAADKTKQGKIVIAYEIDYQTLVKNIEEQSEEDIKTYVVERTKEFN